eukprot:TRINITY_DN31746_c0_g1_i1.p1 TRINITY_DN31746_c0_g1~~TRINITY_DN31746_c0_g1_i1.p1  ORF type:complete len:576 (-),score=130.27 TRINITY_DN31746_c0_g1_i1:32-1759(-)
MALHGINLPLAFIGQEYVWNEVYTQLGLNATDLAAFFTGPAFLPWQRMGNLNAWAGPLPMSWMQQKRDLQLQILARMRDFGMTPILPAFAGHVPPALTNYYPSAKITKLNSWAGFDGTYLLDPLDPLFQRIGSAFITVQQQLYGTQHMYSCDPFNELTPPSNSPAYLSSVGQAIYKSMAAADAQAVWVLQGWFLVNDLAFWQPPQAQALFDSVSNDQMLVLDLFAEVHPVWPITDGFYGKPFIWCMLHNFGGRSGMYATLSRVNQGPFTALANSTAKIVGTGFTPEAIDTNPVAYDLLSDLAWRTSPVDLDAWVAQYAFRRYGQDIPAVRQAWSLLQYSVFDCQTGQQGTSGSLIAGRPALVMDRVSCCSVSALYYDPKSVVSAWQLLLSANSSLAASPTYAYDVLAVTRQALSDTALVYQANIVAAYNSKDKAALALWSEKFLSLVADMDAMLATSPYTLLGSWIADAKQWATNDAEAALYEFNARNQVTLWGPATSNLVDYAYKLWQGLVGDFHMLRWQLFVQSLQAALQANQPFYDEYFVYKRCDTTTALPLGTVEYVLFCRSHWNSRADTA